MIGRALRGEKAGGSSEANIVLFFDDWKRLIDWATPLSGDKEDKEPSIREPYPLEYISIRLVEELAKSIESGGDYEILPFSKIFPIGWYKTEIVYADSDDKQESMEGFTEFVLVYEHTQQKLDAFIKFLMSDTNSLDEWSKEYLDAEWMQTGVEQWIDEWFNRKTDNIGERLNSDLIKLVRHIAQNQFVPPYHSFEERELYDLDKLAQKVLDFSPRILREYLSQEFSKPGTLWNTFYKSFSRFETAVQASIRITLDHELYGEKTFNASLSQTTISPGVELTEKEKEQVKRRDGYACLCCGARGAGVRLQIDHIVPLNFGGETTLENSQTLCSICNGRNCKGINEMNFRFTKTQLNHPKILNLSLPHKDQDGIRAITRIVNFFYHCQAVCQVNWHERRNGKYYFVWEICLYSGNNPEWLLNHKAELLSFIQNELDCSHVKDIKVTVPN